MHSQFKHCENDTSNYQLLQCTETATNLEFLTPSENIPNSLQI